MSIIFAIYLKDIASGSFLRDTYTGNI